MVWPCCVMCKSGERNPVKVVSTSSQATFDDELIAQARAKNHSITSEAVSIGHQAGAYRTILTHFSQVPPPAPPDNPPPPGGELERTGCACWTCEQMPVYSRGPCLSVVTCCANVAHTSSPLDACVKACGGQGLGGGCAAVSQDAHHPGQLQRLHLRRLRPHVG